MALVNHAKKEINAKIVYYGPAGSGKSTALTYIYSRIKPSLRGELKTVPAGADSLRFFDFSPFEAPLPNGYRVRLHIYTLSGIVSNPATWKMTLKGADGIIIMTNPAAALHAETMESIAQLRDFLSAYGVGLHDTPAIVQLNNFSHGSQTESIADIVATFDLATLATSRSNTATGEGVLEALTTLSRQVLDRVTVANEQPDAAASAPIQASATTSATAATTEATETVVPDRLDSSDKYIDNATQPKDVPQVDVLLGEVTSEGRTIRIPLDVAVNNSLRRLVVTVNIDLQ
jgi:signal recognition particle receptor subunit beta